MPSWLITFFLKLAITWGLPALAKAIPWLPAEVLEIIRSIIEGIGKSDTPVDMVREVKKKVSECRGISCGPDLIRDR